MKIRNLLKPLISISLVMLMLFSSMPAYAAMVSTKDYAMMVSAETNAATPSITLSWGYRYSHNSYTIYRKSITDTSWGSVGTATKGVVSWTDTNITIGTLYEYKVTATSIEGSASGYVLSGVNVSAIENRGTVLLVIDDTVTTPLKDKLERLASDLTGDGWNVLREDVSPSLTSPQVKAKIKTRYESYPTLNTVFIFGNVAIAKTGFMAPDGHEGRPFPADAYYGDMDGNWTDTTTSGTSYVPGDGIFDQGSLPGAVELTVGRVDFCNMPVFKKTQLELLGQYLDKDHAYRVGEMKYQKRGFITDGFKVFGGEAFGRNAWGNFPQLTGGEDAVVSGVWRDELMRNSYIIAHINGAGGYDSTGGNLTSQDMANNSYKAVFGQMFGSYFGEWSATNNLMRAFLAMKDYGLTNIWSGRPHVNMHYMGMDFPVGTTIQLSHNKASQYGNYSGVYMGLLGDPTLRLYPVPPLKDMRIVPMNSKDIYVSWTPIHSAVGYNIYRSADSSSPFVKVNSAMLLPDANSYLDENGFASGVRYMVRPITLEKTASGSYYALGQSSVLSLPTKISTTSNVVWKNSANADAETGNLIVGNLSAEFSVNNSNIVSSQIVTTIAILYNKDNGIKQIKTKDFTISSATNTSIRTADLLITALETGDYAKVYLMEDKENPGNLIDIATLTQSID